jgi:hypothetical protein
MSKKRATPMLLLLGSGQVLAIGDGYNECEGECSGYPGLEQSSRYADLYNPVAKTWTATPGLNADRSSYAAVTLPAPDGRVVVAGGVADPPYVCFSSTKLFNPSAHTWSQATGLMKWARCHPASALLQDGRLFLAGGGDIHYTALANTEIFDPATQTWALAASMPGPRLGGQAVTLSNGKVLVVGGTAGYTVLSSAIIYDPTAGPGGTWSAAGSLSATPDGHLVALPDGGALMVQNKEYDNVAEAWIEPASERFDPIALTWTKVPAMNQTRLSPIVVSLADGRVLVAGGTIDQGFDDNGRYTTLTKSAEIYDPATNTWSNTAVMPSARENGRGILLEDGSVLVAGGDLGAHGFAATPGGYEIDVLATALVYVP